MPGASQVKKGEHTAFPMVCMSAVPKTNTNKNARNREKKNELLLCSCSMLRVPGMGSDHVVFDRCIGRENVVAARSLVAHQPHPP